MKKLMCAFAILAAAASTAAVAKDLKQDKKAAAPTVSAQQMTDSEMDKVTAGLSPNVFAVYAPNNKFGFQPDGSKSPEQSPVCFNCCVHGHHLGQC